MKSRSWTTEERSLFTASALTELGALPLHATIKTDESNQLLIRGIPLDYEKALQLRASAQNVLQSAAWRVVKEQVLYEAITKGVYEGLNSDQILFSKSAIWFSQQEEKMLKVLAQDSGELST